MAPKNQAPVEETEETEVEETKAIRPSDLAEELEVSPKALRSFLRREFPRSTDQKNTSWHLTEEMVAKATAHFTEEPEDDESEDDGDES